VQVIEHTLFGSQGRGGLTYEVQQLKSDVSLLSTTCQNGFDDVKADIKQLLDHALTGSHKRSKSDSEPPRSRESDPEGISVRGRFTTRTLIALLAAAGIGGTGYGAYRIGEGHGRNDRGEERRFREKPGARLDKADASESTR
jgi:hypothetical protein